MVCFGLIWIVQTYPDVFFIPFPYKYVKKTKPLSERVCFVLSISISLTLQGQAAREHNVHI